jgi:hypothetical protein
MSGLKNLQNTNICHPEQETWFICWDDTRENIMAYGSIIPTQCMDTPWTQVDYYDDEAEWAAILLENGIDPFPEEDFSLKD